MPTAAALRPQSASVYHPLGRMSLPGSQPLAKYLHDEVERLKTLDLRGVAGLGGSTGIASLPIASIYVNPRLQRVSVSAKTEEPKELAGVFGEHEHVVVLGEPGGGKSTLLKALCVACANPQGDLAKRLGLHRAAPLVPVYVRLAELEVKKPSAPGFEDALRRHLVECHSEATAAVLVEQLRDGHALLCLDGMDEIPNDAARLQTARALEAWAISGRRVWVTSRPWATTPLLGRFVQFALGRFDEVDVRTYVRQHGVLFGAPEDEIRAREQTLLLRDPKLAELVRVPLLMVITLMLEQAGALLPAERILVYQRVFTTLVDTWNRDRRVDALFARPSERFDAQELLDVWADVALDLHTEGKLDAPLHAGDFRRRLGLRLGGSAPERRAEAALAVMTAQAGLLEPSGVDRFRFWHATFGEYLAAMGLARRVREGRARLPLAPRSREIARMAVSWLRSVAGDEAAAREWIRGLLNPRAVGPWAAVFGAGVQLAIACLEDQGAHDDALFAEALSALLDIVERLPTDENAAMLTTLVKLRPSHAPSDAEAARIAALVRPGADRVKTWVTEQLSLWLCRVCDRNAAARACCESLLAVRFCPPVWAAVGVLRAGIPSEAAWEVIAKALAPSYRSQGATWESLAHELAPASRDHDLRAALHAARASSPAPGTPRTDDPRRAALLLLALFGDQEAETLEQLWAIATANKRGSDQEIDRALGWLARQGEPARQLLCERLFGDKLQCEAARRALVIALEAPGKHVEATATTILERIAPASTPEIQALLESSPSRPPLVSALRSIVDANPSVGRVMLNAFENKIPWWLAALLIQTRRDAPWWPGVKSVIQAGLRDPTATVAAASACLLSRSTEAIEPELTAALMKGLLVKEPTIRRESWLRLRMIAFAGDASALVDALNSADPALATAVADILLPLDRHANLRERCEAILRRALVGGDLEQMRVAHNALSFEHVFTDDEDLLCARIRFGESEWYSFDRADAPLPTRRMVETFLDSAPSGHRLWTIASYVARSPGVLEAALERLARPLDERLRVLLPYCLKTSQDIARLTLAAEGTSDATRREVARILAHVPDKLRSTAAQSALQILRRDLESDDLDVVYKATRLINDTDGSLAGARRRIICGGGLQLRLAAVEDILPGWQRSAVSDKEMCLWCGLNRAAVVALIRQADPADDPHLAFRRALAVWTVAGEDDLLRPIALKFVSSPPENDEADAHPCWLSAELAACDRALLEVERSKWRRLGLVTLIALDDAGALTTLVEWFSLTDRYPRDFLGWVSLYKPEWAPQFDPWIARFVERIASSHFKAEISRLRKVAAVFVPAFVRAMWLSLPARLSHISGDSWQDLLEPFSVEGESPSPPDDVLATWHTSLSDETLGVRVGAALVLAEFGVINARVVVVLIEAFETATSLAAGHAWRLLRTPAAKPWFHAERRRRTDRANAPDEAHIVLTLWYDGDPYTMEDVAPLLERVTQSESPQSALSAALVLESHAPQAALATFEHIVETAPADAISALEASAWLLERAPSHERALSRLWSSVPHRPSRALAPVFPVGWGTAVFVLHRHARDDPRLVEALSLGASSAGATESREALWMLADDCGPASVVQLAILEQVARGRGADDFQAVCEGLRPGTPPSGVFLWGYLGSLWTLTAPESGADRRRPRTFHDARVTDPLCHEALLLHGSTLFDRARGLASLAPPLPPDFDLTLAAAVVLDRNFLEVWARVAAGRVEPEDPERLAEALHLQPQDTPGRQLARLWWFARLKSATLLEQEDIGWRPSTPSRRARPSRTPGRASVYRWLHLSDIHFGCRGEARWNQVEVEFFKSLDKTCQPEPIDLVLFTGDLTNRAQPNEFSQAQAFFTRLLGRLEEKTGVRPVLVPVPGNHDLTRPSGPETLEYAAYDHYIDQNNAHGRGLHELLWTSRNAHKVTQLFDAYTTWFQTHVIPQWSSHPHLKIHRSHFPGDFTVVLRHPDRFPLAIVGLNSAWLHFRGDVGPGALAIPTEQFQVALPQESSNPLNLFDEPRLQALLLHHHPREWFAPHMQALYDDSIYTPGRFSICLHGHMHEPSSTRVAHHGNAERCYYQAHSLFGLENYGESGETRSFGYTLGSIREDGEICLRPMQSPPDSAGGFVKDTRFNWKRDHVLMRSGKRPTRR